MMVRNLVAKLGVVSVLSVVASPASAVLIEYELDHFGGNTYQYDYTITNDDLLAGVELFSVYFDQGTAENVSVSASPADWDSVALPDDGFLGATFDTLALTAGAVIDLGETLSGFSVQFDWLGSTAPGGQFFDVFDPVTFTVVSSGATSDGASTSVPEPSGLALLFLGGSALFLTRRKMR